MSARRVASYRWVIAAAMVVVAAGVASEASAAPSFWRTFSDEDWGHPDLAECAGAYVMGGFTCDNYNCDNVQIGCQNVPAGRTVKSPTWNPTTFSEEGTYWQTCPGGQVITAMRCNGDYCDNMSLECSVYTGTLTACQWERNADGSLKTWSGNNAGSWLFGDTRVAAGALCVGSYCGAMGFYTCTMQ